MTNPIIMMIPQNLEDNSVVATWEFNSEHRLKEEGATKNLCHKEIVQKLGRNKFVPQNNCATKTFKTDFINLCFIVGSTEGVLCCACNWARLPFQYLNLKTQKLSIYLWVVPCCTFLRWLPMVWCLLNKNCLRIFVAPSSATSSSGQHLNNTSLRFFLFWESGILKKIRQFLPPPHIAISLMVQVLADDDESKEREVVGRQRHSSVWASLVRKGWWVGGLFDLHLISGENSRSGKKCSHFNFPPKHKW